MKKRWAAALIGIIIFTCILTGCWNYKEVEQLAIVSGVAIDKDGEDKVLVTAEIVNVQQEQKQAALKPAYVQAVGKTFFDAVRAMVALTGRRLYWSHAKVVILSEEITKTGIIGVMDFINRDAELREDMWVLVSREESAREIFSAKPQFESILSYQLDDTMRAQKSISRYPSVELYEFLENIGSEETTTTIPTVKLIDIRGNPTSYITGAAIIKKNKLLGYLGETDTRSLLWIQDELKGGIYPVKDAAGTKTNVSLEIFRSRTKIKPEVSDGVPIIKINIAADVNIGEIMGNEDFINGKLRTSLKKDAEAQIKKEIESIVEKAQKEYKTDFLGFGKNMKRSMPSVWKSIEKEWDEIFLDIETKIVVDIRIRGSARKSKPIKVGE